jgi:putative ABC transport system permease protein
MLGIIIGISSVIAVVALGNGSEKAIGKEFESFGVKRVILYMNWGADVLERDLFTSDDIEAIDEHFSEYLNALSVTVDESASVIANSNKNKRSTVNVHGVDDDYRMIESIDLIDGRFLLEGDIDSKRSNIVISDKMAMDVFGRENVIGEIVSLEIRGSQVPFNVVGLFEKKSSMFEGFGEQSFDVYIPHSLASKLFGYGDFVYTIQANVRNEVDSQATLDRLISFIERRHNNVGQEKYNSYLPENELESINRVMGILTAVVSAIAGISLVVGGIGVMNIMLVSVTERTREIGIRKALGATHKEIMSQFLIEAVIISLIGGMLGTLLGIGLAKIISIFAKVEASADLQTIVIAWAFSAFVGVLFGLLPANKAAKLNPIDALRYE